MITETHKIFISIIIPVSGIGDDLLRLLDSLSVSREMLTRDYYHQIEIVVADTPISNIIDTIPSCIDRTWMQYCVCQNNVRQKRNLGAQIAKGQWIVFIDSDCWVSGQYFTQLIETLLSKPAIQAGSGKIVYQGAQNLNWQVFSQTRLVGVHTDTYQNERPKLWGGAANLIVLKDVFLNSGGFDESLPGIIGGEDIDFCLRLKEAEIELYALNNVVVYHPIEPWSKLHSIVSKTWRWGRIEYHLFERHDSYGVLVSQPFMILFLVLLILYAVVAFVSHKYYLLMIPFIWGFFSNAFFVLLSSFPKTKKEFVLRYCAGFVELLYQISYLIESIKHGAFRNLWCAPVFELNMDNRYKSEVINSYSNLMSLVIIWIISYFAL